MKVWLACVLIGVVVLSYVGWSNRTPSGPGDHLQPVPVPLQKNARYLDLVSPQEWIRIRQSLESPVTSPSGSLHRLLLEVAEHPDRTSDRYLELLTPLLDQQQSIAIYGAPAFVRTRYGIRFRPQWLVTADAQAAESHRDQCLALFGMLGISLDTRIQAEGSHLQVRDLLDDSLASFTLEQQELAWTAIAYALFLPGNRSWSNRFQESFRFDDLVDKLLNRPLDSPDVSCGGLHIVQALAIIWYVHTGHRSMLSRRIERQLQEYLHDFTRKAVRTQADQGYWEIDWFKKEHLKPNETFDNRIIATSHMIEVLSLLPSEFTVPDEVFSRAGLWLKHCLLEARPEQIEENFCPCIHSAIFLRETAGPEFNQFMEQVANVD